MVAKPEFMVGREMCKQAASTIFADAVSLLTHQSRNVVIDYGDLLRLDQTEIIPLSEQ